MEKFVGTLLVLFLVGCVWLVIVAADHSMKAKTKFMDECKKDHKEYECTAMWRAGEPDVVPMPVVIPMNTGR